MEKKNFDVQCRKCSGRMGFEKFYGPSSSFYGWHCFICGDILDPVILLHRLSQDADLSIPESEEELLSLIQRYLRAKPKPRMAAGLRRAEQPATLPSRR